MRLHDLGLATPDGHAALTFHREMTVVSGLDAAERADLVERLLGALAGGADETELRYLAEDGTRHEILVRAGEVLQQPLDGASPRQVVGDAVADASELRHRMVVTAASLGERTLVPEDEPPPLVEARARLRELEIEVDRARDSWARLDDQRAEVDRLAAVVDDLSDRRAEHAWRDDVRRTRQLREELELGTGADLAEEQALLELAAEARRLMACWRSRAERVAELELELRLDAEGGPGSSGGATDEPISTLDDDGLAHLARLPDELPADLTERLDVVDELRRHQQGLRTRLRHLSADVSSANDPIVHELARHDQDELWSSHARVLDALTEVEDVQRRLHGLTLHDDDSAVLLMEEAHRRLVVAEDRAERHLVPGASATAIAAVSSLVLLPSAPLISAGLLALAAGFGGVTVVKPRLDAASAALAEAAAARDAGAPSWFGFHLRRLEASLDRDLSDRLEAAQLGLRLAEEQWFELTGGLDPCLVEGLEDLVRRHAAAMARLGGRVTEIDEVSARLDAVDTQLATALDALRRLCEQRGISDPPLHDRPLLERLIERQTELARRARTERTRRTAVRERDAFAQELQPLLARARAGQRVDATSVARLDAKLERARERVEARDRGRSPQEVRAELDRALARVAALRRPHWSEPVLGSGPDTPVDGDEAERRLQEARQALADMERRAAEFERLRQRLVSMQHRVVRLEGSLSTARRSRDARYLADAEAALQATFTAAGSLGRHRERLPLVFDDTFAAAVASRKWDLLELLRRMAEHNQVLYLTDDPFVTAWASTAASEGRIKLVATDVVADVDGLSIT